MSSASLAANGQNGRWVANPESAINFGIVYRDFLPSLDPDSSSCCSTSYKSFSETVQQANEWLSDREGCEVVACDSLACTSAGLPSYLPDSWPITTHLRGLRVWVRDPNDDESTTESGRSLLSYRDFTPHLGKKNLFSRDYEDSNVVLERLNSYLSFRSSSVRVLGVETLDTPLTGLLDLDVDTEKSSLTFHQHGFTKYCRSLRVFLVTQYHGKKQIRSHSPHPLPRVVFMDFTPKDQSQGLARDEAMVSEMIKRALRWCCTNDGVTFLNLQVLHAKAGKNTTASTWLLENPGHVFNKFFSFVRIFYTIQGTIQTEEKESTSSDEGDVVFTSAGYNLALEFTEVSDNSDAITPRKALPPIKDFSHNNLKSLPQGSESEDHQDNSHIVVEDVPSLPGVISVATAPISPNPISGIYCKTFLPKLVSSGGVCGRAVWESPEETVDRLNAWVAASRATLLNLHTRYVYTRGRSEVDPEVARWVRYRVNGGHVAVYHLVLRGGRSPPTIPPNPPEPTSSCVIL
ncbi:uncharacterized protein LOC121870952 isoform X2 [Homarus americanus]|uniref:uncharacterized protein LOC121870952 isoform X2 n=1 Tax=Homarus americanus TaxID=6706 RepID=UPI001C46F6E9|nr:uncharacterized protein LOC121870952 isoform X2 [Homarus americanus]XP_042228861.1 uncharacterized protein LOC121870952 isoform X2 [Homarus americanus]XP_042228862.1 uncharacterized protein LOC121870952 isoform X2 [Homarus americanus]